MTRTDSASVSVLLVDDEPDFAHLVAEQLSAGNGDLAVDVSTDAESAFDRLSGSEYHCVVSDYEMPGTDGLELLETVREHRPELPFILFTGKGSEEIASEAISAGVTEYMQKTTDPEQFEVLENRVRNTVEKYRTERQLERAETRYRRLVEQNLTGIYILQEGEIVYANPKSAKIFGYGQEEFVGMTAFDIVDEQDHEKLAESLEKRESGEIEEMNYTLTGVRKSGERFEFEVHSGRIEYEGAPAILGSLVDVTEQKAYERELEEYRELVETVGDPMYVLDRDGHVVKTNGAMAEMLGSDRESLVGSHASQFVPEDDREASERLIEGFVRGDVEPPETVELDFRTAGGELIPCEANVTALTDDDGRLRGTVGVVRVIAERKARERELEEYETIVETAPDGVFIIDDEGYFVSGNETGAELIGLDRGRVLGKHYTFLIEEGIVDGEFAERYVETIETLAREGSATGKAKFEATIHPLDGGELTCEIHVAPLMDGEGGFRGHVGVMRDITERKSIETALRTERDRLSALFENITEPTVVYEYEDGEPIVLEANDAFEETFGYDETTVIGESVDPYIVPDDCDDQAGDLNDRVMAGESLDVEIERETADGERRDFLLRNAPIPSDDGAVQGYAIYTDITERKQSEERAQALFRYSTDCIAETEFRAGEPIVRRVNAAFEETFGYDAAEVVGESLDDLIVPDPRVDEATDINDRVVGGEPIEREVTRMTADGERDFLHRAIPFDVGEGAWTYAVYTDITERKERERRLSALHEATRRLMEATDETEVAEIGIEAAESVLGLKIAGLYGVSDDRSALEPMATTDLSHDLFGDLPTFERGKGIIWRVFESGEPLITDDVREEPDVYNPDTPLRSEMILPIGDRGVLMAAAREVGTFDESDRTLAMVLASNVEAALHRAQRETLLREREQALLRQNERLEEFAGVVSHDLRSPLTVAKGNAYLLRQSGDDEYLDKIEGSLDRMEQLIDDLLTLARQGETVDESERVDLGDVAEDAWRSVETASATLTVESAAPIQADPGRLQQLFENLIRNAVEHGGRDVEIRVGTADEAFFVADDGPGIDPTDREKLFETGFTTDEDQGTGFGLSIVEQIAEAHGWEVRICDSRDGGACFEFTGVEVSRRAEH